MSSSGSDLVKAEPNQYQPDDHYPRVIDFLVTRPDTRNTMRPPGSRSLKVRYGRTDGVTDAPSYIDATTHLKMRLKLNFYFLDYFVKSDN